MIYLCLFTEKYTITSPNNLLEENFEPFGVKSDNNSDDDHGEYMEKTNEEILEETDISTKNKTKRSK